jgi:hypothetical protein
MDKKLRLKLSRNVPGGYYSIVSFLLLMVEALFIVVFRLTAYIFMKLLMP